jgi:hypothetical protein
MMEDDGLGLMMMSNSHLYSHLLGPDSIERSPRGRSSSLSHASNLVPSSLTITAAAARHLTVTLVFWASVGGVLMLSLVYLFRIFTRSPDREP